MEYFDQFHIKRFASDVPVIANLGAVQMKEIEHPKISELLKKLEVQSLAIHLNPGQELFQPEGDRDYTGVKEAIFRFIETSPVPVIVKETGFGVSPHTINQLLYNGVSYVDIAGAGGTNWLTIEAYRSSAEVFEVAQEFSNWGIPTGLLLASIGSMNNQILASGGLRTGLDIAKSIALGAYIAGMALPLIRLLHASGSEAVIKKIRQIEKTLRTIMMLTGSNNLTELRQAQMWQEPVFFHQLSAFKKAAFYSEK